MLVARAKTRNHDELLILGLSAENRRRLVMGGPIDLNLGEMHGPLAIVIFAGETEESMQAELFSLIDDRTTITKISSRQGSQEVP